MKFDGNQAWKQAAAWVGSNRDLVIALAGVFFLIPGLAIGLFAPQPTPVTGMRPEQIMVVMRGYYLQTLPYTIPVLLLQALGSLALLRLFTDRQRPTVGESIRLALSGLVTYVASQLLLGLAIGVFAGVAVLIAAISGLQALLLVAALAILIAFVYLLVRTSLSGPAIAIERVRNPVTALTRSWHLTRGNTGRLTLFYVIIGVLLLVVTTAIDALFGIVLSLALGRGYAQVVLTVISSTLSAAVTAYFVAIIAAVHRQLAGPALSDQRATFE